MTVSKERKIEGTLEQEYSKRVSLAHRKNFAQFFTPYPIAELMCKWLIGNKSLKTVLEPAFGLGVFSRALLSSKNNIEIKGFEVDNVIFETAKKFFDSSNNVNLVLQDYMYNDWNNKYDGIICNPPYFKFHDYDNKEILKEIENRLNCKLNGFTNLYTLFLLKSIHQLQKDGRCAYLIPSEFLNSDYGVLVKNFLIKSRTLRHIIVIDFEENVFDDALTTSSIILCANDNLMDKVQFSNVTSLSDFEKIEELICDYSKIETNKQNLISFSELIPDIKWKAYYQKQNCLNFKNLVPFSKYAKVVRGIATGSNDYFTFNISKAKDFAIEEKYLLPCICSAKDAKSAFFTQNDYKNLKDSNKTVFLFNAYSVNNHVVDSYIKKGELEEINKKFLTSKRNPWYALENRPPAPIWVSVFNRSGLRFIRNEAKISNLTSFHCIYPKQADLFSDKNIDILFAYLLTDTAKLIFEDNCRQYGNGLQKFEPNDLNKGMMLDINLLDASSKKRILELYNHYRLLVIENKSGDEILLEIDSIFSKEFSIKKHYA